LPDAVELVKTIKKAALEAVESTKPVNVYFGTVESASPLKINVEQKMVLGENQLILARNVTEYTSMVTVQWSTEQEKIRHRHQLSNITDDAGDKITSAYTDYQEVSHDHDIEGTKQMTFHNALEKGEEVILIRQQEGQKYVVIDRIGGGSS
jgi:hypothetical protein